jgi:GlpG protein
MLSGDNIMRDIGSIANELDANVFRDFLYNQGIETAIEQNRGGDWSVWVQDENQLTQAEALLKEFLDNPSAGKFIQGSEDAVKRRLESEKNEKRAAKNFRTRDDIFKTYGFAGIGHVTVSLIAVCIAVTFMIKFGANKPLFQHLAIAEMHQSPGLGQFYYRHLQEVRSGQVWRLVTPLFMHLGIMHIIFNMMWLRDLGSMMERQRGPVFICLFILVAGVLSNVGQYYVAGPNFGGMSGVIYGLLGYAWMQSRFNPWSGFVLHTSTVQMMLIWFVLCMTGLVGNIANATHAVGLVVGVAWGYWDARRRVPE